MQLTPRYDGPPVLQFVDPPDDLALPLGRQRRRLGQLLDGLDDDQWAAPSRCEGWSVRDVVAHLVGTDRFWTASVRAGLAGTPTRYLVGFDPVATPAAMVAGTRAQPAAEVLADYHEASEGLIGAVTALEPEQWAMAAEGPPGHLPLHAIVRHALWDAWIHERDVAVPLGLDQEQHPDELTACLEYAAALGPGLHAAVSPGRTGSLGVAATDPDLELLVELGESVVVSHGPAPADAAVLRGRALDLVEGLSLRAPLTHDVAEEDRWLLSGLATAFDQGGEPTGTPS